MKVFFANSAPSLNSFLADTILALKKFGGVEQVIDSQTRPDVVFIEWIFPGYTASLLRDIHARFPGVPIYVRDHGYAFFQGWYENVPWEWVAGLIVPSEPMADLVRDNWPARLPVRVVPNGVDTEIFKPGQRKYPEIQQGLRFLAVQTMNYKKPTGLLIAAFGAILAEYPTSTLDIYGNFGGPDAFFSREEHWLKSRTDLQEAVKVYLQPVPHNTMPTLFAQYDCLLYATMFDSFGLTVAEAMACDMPVCVSWWPGVERIFPWLQVWLDPTEVIDVLDCATIFEAAEWGKLTRERYSMQKHARCMREALGGKE